MPLDAPAITRTECVAADAELYLVDGLIEDAGRLINTAVRARPDYQDVSTLKEPYRLEGKKTMGYEIVGQLGWRVPDVILYPTGGGVGLIGIYKALLEMQDLGWIGPDLPRLVGVQAEGCAPIVQAFTAGAKVSERFPDAHTIAFGITVPKALGDFLALDAIRATAGTAVAVSDTGLLSEQRALAATGPFICPEGAACLAAAPDSGFYEPEQPHPAALDRGQISCGVWRACSLPGFPVAVESPPPASITLPARRTRSRRSGCLEGQAQVIRWPPITGSSETK